MNKKKKKTWDSPFKQLKLEIWILISQKKDFWIFPSILYTLLHKELFKVCIFLPCRLCYRIGLEDFCIFTPLTE